MQRNRLVVQLIGVGYRSAISVEGGAKRNIVIEHSSRNDKLHPWQLQDVSLIPAEETV